MDRYNHSFPEMARDRIDPALYGRRAPFDLQIFAQEKTEEPTPRKRRKEREEGRVAQSKDLTAAVSILTGTASLLIFSGFMWNSYSSFLHWCLIWLPTAARARENWTFTLAAKGTVFFMKAWLPIAFIGMILCFFITALQVGLKASPKPLIPKMDRFDLVKGIKKMFSLRSFVEALKALLKAVFLFIVLYYGIRKELPLFQEIARFDPSVGFGRVLKVFFHLSIRLGMALLVLGIFDFGFQKWEFSKSIRMTKQEIKDEFKQTEGDPMIRQRIRRKQAEIGRNRMMSKVPEADVIVTNPTHFAVALKYDRKQMGAPVVLAKGAGYLALRIKEIAREENIPLFEDKPLARGLYRTVEVGEEIPEDLYVAVAEVLAYVYSLKKETSGTPGTFSRNN